LVTYRNKCPAPGIEPGHGRPSQYYRSLTSLIKANALTTTPDHQPPIGQQGLDNVAYKMRQCAVLRKDKIIIHNVFGSY